MVTNGINSLGIYGLNLNFNQPLTGLGTTSNYGNTGALGGSVFGQQANMFGSTSGLFPSMTGQTDMFGASSGLNALFPGMFGAQTNSLGSSSGLSSLFGDQATDTFGTAAGTEGDLYSIENLNKAIDVNGDGTISEEEIATFLKDPMGALQKAAANKNEASDPNSMMTSILSMLKELLTGQKAADQTGKAAAQPAAQAAAQPAAQAAAKPAAQAATGDTAALKKQLQEATANSDNLKKQLETQKTDVKEAADAAKKAAEDAKAAGAKADASAKALTDYKNSHGDEDPKLFAKEFGQLLDENKNNAISRQEFQKVAVAAGEDLKLNKQEWDSLVDASKLADANKADLKAQVAASDVIDAKGLEENLFKHDKDGDGSVEAGAEINSFATDVASNDANDGAVNTGDLAAESFEIEAPAAEVPAEDPPAEPAGE